MNEQVDSFKKSLTWKNPSEDTPLMEILKKERSEERLGET